MANSTPSDFTPLDLFSTDPYTLPDSESDAHDVSSPPDNKPADRSDSDAPSVCSEDLESEGEEENEQREDFEPRILEEHPVSTGVSTSLETAELQEGDGQAGQEYTPDAFDLPDSELESPAGHPGTQELEPEVFDLPESDASAEDLSFGPEVFDLSDLDSLVEHADGEALRPEDSELPEIEAPVENLDEDIHSPDVFELPTSSMCPLPFNSHLIYLLQAAPIHQNRQVQHYHHLVQQSSPKFVPSAPNVFRSAVEVHRVQKCYLSFTFGGMWVMPAYAF